MINMRRYRCKEIRYAGQTFGGQVLAEIETPELDQELAQARWVIPANTLLMCSNGPHVAIVGADNTVRRQKVTLGRDFGGTVEVLVGLHGCERLVVNPADDLRAGQAVQVAETTDSHAQVAPK
jgi:hypothetical protein